MVAARGVQAIVIIGVFEVLAVISFLLRVYTRFVLTGNDGKEDYCLAFAVVCSIAMTVLMGLQVKYGMGQHIAELAPETIVNSLKPFWGSIWVYYLSLTFIKVSVLLQYLRIFTIRGFRIACWTVLAVVVLFSFWTFFGSIFICTPVAFFWDKTIEGGKCMDEFAVWFTNAGFNIVTDFASILLPMTVLKDLHLPRRQRWALAAIFALGGFGCLVSILRLRSLVAISNSTDPTYDNPPAATWSSIECSVGIICASLPALKPLLAKVFPASMTSHPSVSTRNLHHRDYYVSKHGGGPSFTDRAGSSAGSIVTMGSELADMDPEKGVHYYNQERHRAQISTRVARSANPVFDQARNQNDIEVVTVVEQKVSNKGLSSVPESSC